jgi:hypothetical protein
MISAVGRRTNLRHRYNAFLAAVTVAGWLLLAWLIASLYVGHSPSPYGTCAARNGRMVACSLLHR